MLNKILLIITEFFDLIRGAGSKLVIKNITKDILNKTNKKHQQYVIVCLYETAPRSDLKLLFRRFAKLNFGIIAVVSNDAYKQYEGAIDIVVKVASIGRDFLAYQQGFRAIKTLEHFETIESLCFLNDSVWYFQKYQSSITNVLVKGLKQEQLVVGTLILDEIPHVSGWLFAIPLESNTLIALDSLFQVDFARKSRMYNIRKGEHKVLTTLGAGKNVLSLDEPNKKNPATAQCYDAFMDGTKCFYIKGDSTFRTNPMHSNLEIFLHVNATETEKNDVLLWLARKADTLLASGIIRRHEFASFQNRFYNSSNNDK